MARASSNCVLALLPCALAAACAAAAATRPAVVELYTSEGCSSCPPADALLGELKKQPHVLALAFHVSYWDRLGWADRFALPYADERQSRYAQALHLPSVFTPQIIIDAQRSFIGADRGAILPALQGERDGVAIRITREGDMLVIDLARSPSAAHAEVVLLALVPETQTAINRGENGGRTLREFNIVRARFALGSWNGAAAHYRLPCAQLPADSTEAAVLIQQPGQRAILGAARFAWQ